MEDWRAVHTPKSKNESITFRLDSITVAKMRKEAEEKEISVNTLVSQIIRNHFDWHSTAPRAGFISVRRTLVKTLLDKHTDEETRSLAQYIGNTSNRDYLLLLRSKITLDSAIDFFESWLRVCGFAYRHEITNGIRHSYFIQHDMGKKWSIYLAVLYQHLFEECNAANFQTDVRENSLSIIFDSIKRRN